MTNPQELVERLRSFQVAPYNAIGLPTKCYVQPTALETVNEAAALITAQAQEIERLQRLLEECSR